jgi:hypothetical protein
MSIDRCAMECSLTEYQLIHIELVSGKLVSQWIRRFLCVTPLKEILQRGLGSYDWTHWDENLHDLEFHLGSQDLLDEFLDC